MKYQHSKRVDAGIARARDKAKTIEIFTGIPMREMLREHYAEYVAAYGEEKGRYLADRFLAAWSLGARFPFKRS